VEKPNSFRIFTDETSIFYSQRLSDMKSNISNYMHPTNTTLVIHMDDRSTDFLKPIYENMECNVLRTHVSDAFTYEAIKSHHRIIMMGHGSPLGLFSKSGYIVDNKFIDVLKDKPNNIYIWCYASTFVKKHNLKGFATGMFISELYEATINNVKPDKRNLDYSNAKFTDLVKESITMDPMSMYSNIFENYKDEVKNSILDFNKSRLILTS